jgi:hypothetical protein
MKSFRRLLFALSLLSVASVQAQSVSHYFVQMPGNLIPAVSIDARKDLIDFLKNGKTAAMPSAFGGQVILKELSEDYLLLQTSEKSDLQLKILHVNDSLRVLAVVHSVSAPLKDSYIRFYTTTWQPCGDLQMPVWAVGDFIDMEKSRKLGLTDRLNEIGPRLFVSCQFKPSEPILVAHSSLKDDLQPEQAKEFGPVIRDSVVCVLQGNHFERLGK